MDTFFLVLILILQIVNLVLLVALANILVRAAERTKNKTKPISNREQGLLDLPLVPNYAQIGLPGPSEGLVLLKDQ